MTRILAGIALAAVALGAAPAVLAQTSTVKFGGIRYDTHAKTDGITGIGVPAGADAKIGDANTLLVTYERLVMPNVGVELVLGIPPKIKATGSGSVAFLGEVLSARNASPTLLVNYHFGQPGDTWRPYVGVGVNYTKFIDVKTPYGWDVELGDSVGWAAKLGVDYAIDKHWGLYGSIAAEQVKSKLVATGATVLQTTIDFRPTTYSFGVSYRF